LIEAEPASLSGRRRLRIHRSCRAANIEALFARKLAGAFTLRELSVQEMS
jgi:hypothetical protein